VTWPYGRRTVRLYDVLQCLGLALGGEPGCRVAKRLAMPVSGDTMLRTVRRAAFPPPDRSRVIGVDDWALRRGQRYGTLIVDLERHHPVDLLPDRRWETFRDWLAQHPGVEVISRDRANRYLQGAAAGAPEAVQVVDRWHLLKNLREALKRSAERFSREIQQAASEVSLAKHTKETAPPAATAPLPTDSPILPTPAAADAPLTLRETRRLRRLERYQRVHELHAQGKSQRRIARTLHLDRDTVRRFLQAASFPERAARSVPRDTDPYVDYLRQRWSEGCFNARVLMCEITAQGYRGSYDAVKRRVAGWRQQQRSATTSAADSATGNNSTSEHRRRSALDRPSANRVAWLLFLRPEELKDQEQSLREVVCQRCPALAEAAELAHVFCDMVKQRDAGGLSGWIARASAATVTPEIRRFAIGLLADLQAIESALRLPWSNGQTEGQVNRLKLLKREMYGRAKLDLLSQRFLHPLR
jgi:transposase